MVITDEPAHRLLYTTALKPHFATEFSPSVSGGEGTVDAVVYDIPGMHGAIDLEWINSLDMPVVVLATEEYLPVADTPTRRVLSYPVKADDLLDALAELGVTSCEKQS
jgi:hypothetical protein